MGCDRGAASGYLLSPLTNPASSASQPSLKVTSILRNHEVVSTPKTVDKALNPSNLMADRPGLAHRYCEGE
jgi:hypothetical protein